MSEPVEVDYSVLHFIRAGKPIAFDDILQLWNRTQDYIIVETVVDIAMRKQMPLWAAEEVWRNDQQNSPNTDASGL